MLSAYVEVLLCVIELLAFVAFKNTTQTTKDQLNGWPDCPLLFQL